MNIFKRFLVLLGLFCATIQMYSQVVVPLFEADFECLRKECKSTKDANALKGCLTTMSQTCDSAQRDQVQKLSDSPSE